MRKTNFKSISRLMGQVNGFCYRDALYSKAILFFALCLFPSLIFAQEKQSEEIKAKQEFNQAWLEAKQGNRPEAIQDNKKARVLTNAEKTEQLELNYLVEKFNLDLDKMLQHGYSKQQIITEYSVLLENGNSSTTALRTADCGVPTLLTCNNGPIFGDTFGRGGESPDPHYTSCNVVASSGVGVWYRVIGDNANNTVTAASVSGTPIIEVYSIGDENNPCTSLQCLGGTTYAASLNSATFFAAGGIEYYVFVADLTGVGSWNIDLTTDLLGGCTADPEDGAGSDTAFSIACGDVDSGSSVGFVSTETGANCGAQSNANGVWYKFTSPFQDVVVSLCNSDYDTTLNIYEREAGTTDPLACVDGSDDDCGSRSEIAFSAFAGTEYFAYISGWNGASGNYEINLQCGGDASPPRPQVPANDDCANATPLICNTSMDATNVLAGSSDEPGTGDCAGSISSGSPGVWFEYLGDGSSVTIATCGIDTEIFVYSSATDSCGPLTCVTDNDDAPFDPACSFGGDSSVTFNADAGTFYYAYVVGWNGAEGDFTITTTCDAPVLPPDNDFCIDADPLVCNAVTTGDTSLASAEDAPIACFGFDGDNIGVWYSYVGDGQVVDIALCGSTFDTQVSVFTGSCGDFECVADNDDSCGLQSEVRFTSAIGTTYYIYVFGFGNTEGGAYTMEVTCQPDPCADAIPIACGGNATGTTVGGSTAGPTDFCGTTPGATGVYYVYEGEGDFVTASLCGPGTDFDTLINVYSGDCGDLTCLTGNDQSCGDGSEVTFYGEAGTRYYMWISGWQGATGNYELDITCTPTAENDLCGDAIALGCDVTVEGSTTFSTNNDNPERDCDGQFSDLNEAPGVWYTLQGTGGEINLSMCTGTNFDSKILVLTGADDGDPCGTLECYAGNDDFCGLQSEVQFATEEGQTYYVFITGFGSGSGDYTLTVDCVCVPGNFDTECVTVYEGYDPASTATLEAELLHGEGVISYAWSNGATTNPITVNASDGTSNYSVVMTDEEGCTATQDFFVYSVDIDCDRGGDKVEICHNGTTICVSVNAVDAHLNHGDSLGTCGTQLCDQVEPLCDNSITSPADQETGVFTTPVIIWTAASGIVDGYNVSISEDGGAEVVNADAGDNLSYAAAGLDFNTVYTVTVTPYNSNGSSVGCASNTFETEMEPTGPPGETLASAIVVTCGSSTDGDNDGSAATPPNTFCDEFPTSSGRLIGNWHVFVGNGDTVTADLCTSQESDTKLNVYTGADIASLTCLVGNDDECGARSEVTFNTTAGTNYYIWVSTWSSFGIDPHTLNITCSGARTEAPTDLEWNMYPNPSKGVVNLDLNRYMNNEINVQVIDLAGNVVLRKNVANLQDPKLQIELNNVPYGMYFVRVMSNNTVSTKKLIINN